MRLVRIVKNWDWPDLLRQTPGNKGIWENITFTLNTVEECDYVIVLNNTKETAKVCCPPQHVWSIIQEPPIGWAKPWHVNPWYSFRTFTCDTDLSGPEYLHSHPALPWHINKNYDELIACNFPEKTRTLSWITSNVQVLNGHYARMKFMKNIRGKITYDLFGRGFNPIEDKWDGLAPYRYSLVIENFSNAYYWTEKIADCFLAWTMPIYYGCTRITDYFPSEAIICIDIHASDVVEQIKSALSEDVWKRNLDAIAYARELVLNQYQLFPFVTRQIQQFECCYGSQAKREVILITPPSQNSPAVRKIFNHSETKQTGRSNVSLLIRRLVNKFRSLIKH